MRRRRVLVVGGGCYGRHFLQRLERGRARGGETFDIWVLDRDADCVVARGWSGSRTQNAQDRFVRAEWSEFLRSYLDVTGEDAERRGRDLLVPSPLAPHLFALWLASGWGRCRVTSAPFPVRPELAYCSELDGGGLAVSHAAWRCPTHCVEPRLCPATRQTRDWDLSRSLLAYARQLRAASALPVSGPHLSQCVAWREGVGVVVLGDWPTAAARARSGLAAGGLLIAATVSSCHGVAHLLEIEAPAATAEAHRLDPPARAERSNCP